MSGSPLQGVSGCLAKPISWITSLPHLHTCVLSKNWNIIKFYRISLNLYGTITKILAGLAGPASFSSPCRALPVAIPPASHSSVRPAPVCSRGPSLTGGKGRTPAAKESLPSRTVSSFHSEIITSFLESSFIFLLNPFLLRIEWASIQ